MAQPEPVRLVPGGAVDRPAEQALLAAAAACASTTMPVTSCATRSCSSPASPAVAVPVLRDERGLNWSVQLIGRPGTSAPLLALAAHLELLLAG